MSPRTRGRALTLLGLVTALLPAACATVARGGPAATLAASIDSIIGQPPLAATHWGIEVKDRATGRILYARNAGEHFIPASNTKLVVTTVAMGELGPAFRYSTDVFAEVGPGDSVAAALLVAGTGDPTWSVRFEPWRGATLDAIADSIRARGIRRVNGDLIVDASRFEAETVHSAWEVGDLPWTYAPPVDAFAVDETTFAVLRAPGTAPGQPATAHPIGDTQPFRAWLTTDTAGADITWRVDYRARRDTVFVHGAIAAGAPPDTVELAVTRPAYSAGRALIAALAARGITVGGRVLVTHDSLEARTLRDSIATPGNRVATHASPPLDSIIAGILHPSQNWIAEQLLKTLGAERAGRGAWREGLAVERRYLVEVVGLDSLAFSLRDASGLSAQDLLTPDATVRILEHAADAPWAAAFRNALPAPGLDGSTLEHRLSGLEQRVRAKTGTISNVNSLSGYATTGDGREVTFSILSNGSGLPSAIVRNAIDSIVRAIASDGGSP